MIEAGSAEDASDVAKNNLQLIYDSMQATVYAVAQGLARENSDLILAISLRRTCLGKKIANARKQNASLVVLIRKNGLISQKTICLGACYYWQRRRAY